jgi:hypothetical protein
MEKIIDKNNEVLYRLKDLPISKGAFWHCDTNKSYFPLSKILHQVLENSDLGSILKLVSMFNYDEIEAAYKKIKPEFYKKQEIGYIALMELLGIIIDIKKEDKI